MKKQILLSIGTIGTVITPIAGFISCGDDEIGDKDIAFVISTKNNPYFTTLANSAEKEAKKYGYKLHIFVSNNKQDVEADKIDIIIAKGFKTLILNGLNAKQSAAAAKKAIDAGIKVIAVDRKLAESAGDVWTTISSANKQGAKKLAKRTLALFKSKSITSLNMLHLQGLPGEQNGIDRWDGVEKLAIKAQSDITITNIYEARANYDRTQGNDETSSQMTSHPQIKWINADNDEMALGAIRALGDKAGIDPSASHVIVTGFDGNDDAINAVNSGKMFGTVKQDAAAIGAKAVDAAIEASGGKDFLNIEKGTDVEVPVNLITKDNISDYLKK